VRESWPAAVRLHIPETVLRGRRWSVLAILGGGLLFVWGIRDLGASYAATQWPFTPGRVLQAVVVDSVGREPHPFVEYEYILAGRMHRSHTISNATGLFGLPRRQWTRAKADSIVAVFPAGAEIKVAYDPGNTEHSLLVPRMNWMAMAPLTLGLVLLIYGIKVRSSARGAEVG
jgi:Protein of unknown function (DUF3592)